MYCQNNNLISLKGIQEKINGNFDCSRNKLSSLENCPKEIKDVLHCKLNPYLKNVKEQIIQYQIKAKKYRTDEGDFTFEDIKKEFLEYKKQKQIQKKQNTKKKIQKIKNTI